MILKLKQFEGKFEGHRFKVDNCDISDIELERMRGFVPAWIGPSFLLKGFLAACVLMGVPELNDGLSASESSAPRNPWPPPRKVQLIRTHLTSNVTELLRIQPRVAEWGEQRFKKFVREMQEDGFKLQRDGVESIYRALTLNPRLVTLKTERRREGIRWMKDKLGIKLNFIFANPLLLGHYLKAAMAFVDSLDGQQVRTLRSLGIRQRRTILMAIRAADFELPAESRFGENHISRIADEERCTAWVRMAADFTRMRKKS